MLIITKSVLGLLLMAAAAKAGGPTACELITTKDACYNGRSDLFYLKDGQYHQAVPTPANGNMCAASDICDQLLWVGKDYTGGDPEYCAFDDMYWPDAGDGRKPYAGDCAATPSPTPGPTPSPTKSPATTSPTTSPTPGPTGNPTPGPTSNLTPGPTTNPTPPPTSPPTPGPTASPTLEPVKVAAAAFNGVLSSISGKKCYPTTDAAGLDMKRLKSAFASYKLELRTSTVRTVHGRAGLRAEFQDAQKIFAAAKRSLRTLKRTAKLGGKCPVQTETV